MGRIRWALWVGGVALLVGCGGGEEGFTSTEMLDMHIAEVADAARSQERFESYFAPGAAPGGAERARYGKLTFRMKSATVKDGTGTATVQVENIQNDVIGEVEWGVVQEDGGKWKLTSAPLP